MGDTHETGTMVTRIDIKSRVDASAEELFDLMADPETEEQWNPDAIEVHRVGEGPIGPGARWDGRYKGMGTMHITLDEYERPDRLVFSITGSRMDMHWTFTYAADGTGTQLAAAAELAPKGAMRMFAPLLGPMMRRTFSKRPAQLAEGVAKRRAAGTAA
jgi:uncharacterized protein YndB with AHSA1/START domain